MKKSIFLLFIVFIFFSGCTSAKFEEMKAIPEDYENVYICFDSSQTIIGRGPSFSSGNGYFSYNSGWSHSTTLDTIENRNIAIKILTQRGYKVVSNIKEADIVLLGGYSSNEIRSKVSLAFLDAYTEELLFTTEGMYGMGWDINGDVRGALKNALNSIPDKSNSEKQKGIIISENKSASEMNEIEMQLIKLKQLYDDGLMDEDEYKEKKSKVLGL